MNFMRPASLNSISGHAEDLLGDVVDERERAEEADRPIIFVGHSMGGLVIKDALCKSQGYESTNRHRERAAIKRLTKGIFFFGTPHQGSSHAAWGSMMGRLADFMFQDRNDHIVEALKSGSETIERLQHDFNGIAPDFERVYTCLEALPYPKIGKIVDDHSAILGLKEEVRYRIHADHSGMCKFTERGGTDYKRVMKAMRRLTNGLSVSGGGEEGQQLVLHVPNMEHSRKNSAISDDTPPSIRSDAIPRIASNSEAEEIHKFLGGTSILQLEQTHVGRRTGISPINFPDDTRRQGCMTTAAPLLGLSIHSSRSRAASESTSAHAVIEDLSTIVSNSIICNDEINEDEPIPTASLDLEITNPWNDVSNEWRNVQSPVGGDVLDATPDLPDSPNSPTPSQISDKGVRPGTVQRTELIKFSIDGEEQAPKVEPRPQGSKPGALRSKPQGQESNEKEPKISGHDFGPVTINQSNPRPGNDSHQVPNGNATDADHSSREHGRDRIFDKLVFLPQYQTHLTPIKYWMDRVKHAIRTQDVQSVHRLLAGRIGLSIPSLYLHKLLFKGVSRGNMAILRLLIVEGFREPNPTWDLRLFKRSLRLEVNDVAQFLVEDGIAASSSLCDNDTALHEAARTEIAWLVLTLRERITPPRWRMLSPIHLAAALPNVEMIEILLDAGAEIESRTDEAVNFEVAEVQLRPGLTPLHVSVSGRSKRYAGAVRFLLGRGADIMACTGYFDTPLHLAIEYSTVGMTLLIVKSGGFNNIYNDNGYTPLHQAVARGLHDEDSDFLQRLDTLLEYGAEIDRSTWDGTATALGLTIRHNAKNRAEALLDRGASLTKRNKYEQTPLDVAIHFKSSDIMEMLRTNMLLKLNETERKKVIESAIDLARRKGLHSMVPDLEMDLPTPRLVFRFGSQSAPQNLCQFSSRYPYFKRS
ncbi:MAG: glycine hydroxymethyltransferase shm1 [Watsoniomyces obsoletus]|nr:MAG: glycine hydroxymethyltransferase shm1 [Watsoniomyces obsoletus]